MQDRLRILVVDDDALDREAARRALLASDLDVEVVEAERGAETLDRLAAEAFDGVLLDFQLPDADGLEILREARARGIMTPIIMLTGHGDELIAVELMKAGAADYFSKSNLLPHALARSLRHAVRVRQAEAEASRANADRGWLMENLAAEQGQMEAVLTSMTDGLIVSALDGNVLAMNPAAMNLLGYRTDEEVDRHLSEFTKKFEMTTLDGVALALEEWPLARALRGETFSGFEATLHRRDTGNTWIGSYAGTPARGRTGEAILAIVTFRDITSIKKAQQRAAFLAEAGTILASSLDVHATLENVARWAVPEMVDWCAINIQELSGMIRPLVTAHADPVEEARARKMQQDYPLDPDAETGVGYVLRTGKPQLIAQASEAILSAAARDAEHLSRLRAFGICSYLCVPLWARGRILGTLSLSSTRSGRIFDEDDLVLAQELGRRISAALDNARLFEEAQLRAEREALINKIGQALRVTLDTDEILQIVTEQVGQSLRVSRCSWARLSSARDVFEVAPQQYTRPGVPPLTFLYRLADCPPDVVDAWTSGQPVVSHDYTQDPVSLAAGIRDLTRAFIACPVFLRGQFRGLFIVHQNDGPRDWTADEIAFLSAVTDILALALENARLYTREHRVADMLQSAFLPDIPPLLSGLALNSSYRAGLEESRVGGDYYDAFPLPDGRVALVIADVSGKGLNAAVQTATVKYSLRAFATEAAAPGLVLTRLNKLLCSDLSGLGDHFVTLFYAVFDPASGLLVWTNAGHETMIIKRAAGGAALLEANNPILGIADHLYEQSVEALKPGDSLILYTDGLTEARATGSRQMMELERVLELVETAPPEAGPGALAARLQNAAMQWTGERPQDDMALLVARRRSISEMREDEMEGAADSLKLRSSLSWGEIGQQTAKDSVGEEKAGEERLFDFRFPSRADCAAEIRQLIGHWMLTLGFDREATEDFQTAVTEAVTNAVRHGSPAAAELQVTGWQAAEGALRVEVTDSGPGVPPAALYHAMPEPDALGGRGLPLMQELADSVEFLPMAGRHRVVLLKRLPLSRAQSARK